MYSVTTRLLLRYAVPITSLRPFSALPALSAKPLPPLPVLHDGDITESFLRGTGPGGQKINKTSSAVQLQHHPTGIVVKCQETRSRATNRAMARRLLQEKIEEQQLGDKSRTKMKEEREGRRKRSGEKKRRRKYRALEEEKDREKGEAETEEVGGVDGECQDMAGETSVAKPMEHEARLEDQKKKGG